MIPLDVILDGDGAFQNVPVAQRDMGTVAAVAVLAGGTVSGKPTVCLRVNIDGVDYLAETTWALFNMAHVAIAARYGIPE